MKILISCIFLMISTKSGFCQIDKPFIQDEPLFRMVDSVSTIIERSQKDFVFSICRFGLSKQSAAVIWKGKEKYGGIYFKEKGEGQFTSAKIPRRKIKLILSNRLLSESCNLCDMLNGENKIDLDHDYMLYIRRRVSGHCKEMYFTIASAMFYNGSNSCVNDLELISL